MYLNVSSIRITVTPGYFVYFRGSPRVYNLPHLTPLKKKNLFSPFSISRFNPGSLFQGAFKIRCRKSGYSFSYRGFISFLLTKHCSCFNAVHCSQEYRLQCLNYRIEFHSSLKWTCLRAILCNFRLNSASVSVNEA